MNVVTLAHGWYPDDINSKLNFDEFKSTIKTDDLLLVGVPCTEEPEIIKVLPHFNRTVYINLEHPCTLYGGNNRIGLTPIEQQTIFTEVYTICPYTAEWINNLNLGTKMVAMPYMHNLAYNDIKDYEKTHDVAYAGLIHHKEIASYIETMAKHRHIFTTIPEYNRIHVADHLATHTNILNTEKWKILAKTKMSIIQNNLYLKPDQIENVRQLPHWESNEAFSHIESGLLPQLKSRTVESALCKSLLLVKKDPWNVIEHWFKPDEDFIYFEDCEDLDNKITQISNDYQNYQQIVDNAYNKVINYYNTKYIFQRIKEGLEIL